MAETGRDSLLWNGNTETPALLASRCRDCGTKGFPPRTVCGQCYSTIQERITLPRRGTVFAFCRLFSRGDSYGKGPQTVGYILLEDGMLIPARLLFGDELLQIGTPVVLSAGPGKPPPEKTEQQSAYYFVPENKGEGRWR